MATDGGVVVLSLCLLFIHNI